MKQRSAVEFFRVSSKRQEDGFSLSAQKNLAQKYIKENNFKVIKSWSVSESASKEKDRKHFYSMLEFVQENGIKDIVFDKVDRACRGYRSAYLVEELISDYDVRFHFVRDHLSIDKNSPMSDRDRFGIGVWMGKRYSENLRMEVIKGMDERRNQGHWNHKAPIGYENVRKGKVSKVEFDPEVAPVIKQIFELYSTGNYTQKELSIYLQEKLSEKKITKSVVEITLLNPFYYGFMRNKGQVVKGNHKALVSKSLWDNCQRIRGLRAYNTKRNDLKAQVAKPLMGLFRCGECLAMVSGETKIKPNGAKYIYYHCGNPKCLQKSKNTRHEVLMAQTIECFKPFEKLNAELIGRVFKKAQENIKTNSEEGQFLKSKLNKVDLTLEKGLKNLRDKKMELDSRLEKLKNLQSQGLLSQDEYKKLLQIKKEEQQGLQVETSRTLEWRW